MLQKISKFKRSYSKFLLSEEKLNKIKEKTQKKEEILEQVQSPKITNSLKTQLLQEYKTLTKIQKDFVEYEKTLKIKQELQKEFETVEPELKEIYLEELEISEKKMKESEENLINSIIHEQSNEEIDESSCILEVHAGTGGDEAGIFSYELFKMYELYSKSRGWTFKRLNTQTTISAGNKEGLREAIASIKGDSVLKTLKYEGGTHRVQRVPVTDSVGRVHTSTSSVIILPEAKEIQFKLHTKDLRIDTFKSRGAGGQSVNTTDSAVRVTHIPTGMVASCQDERDQHTNKARAMDVLRARLYDAERMKIEKETTDSRTEQRGTASRSDKIRTYNFAQDRITDHRIGLSQFGVENLLKGDAVLFDTFVQELQFDEEKTKFEKFFK
jgi:peptide chain release factor 1